MVGRVRLLVVPGGLPMARTFMGQRTSVMVYLAPPYGRTTTRNASPDFISSKAW